MLWWLNQKPLVFLSSTIIRSSFQYSNTVQYFVFFSKTCNVNAAFHCTLNFLGGKTWKSAKERSFNSEFQVRNLIREARLHHHKRTSQQHGGAHSERLPFHHFLLTVCVVKRAASTLQLPFPLVDLCLTKAAMFSQAAALGCFGHSWNTDSEILTWWCD